MEMLFDNAAVLLRGQRCLVSQVTPPFKTAYWPNIGMVSADLKLPTHEEMTLGERQIQHQFLASLAARRILPEELRLAGIGFQSRAEDIRQRDRYRERRLLITFVGACSMQIVLASLEIGAQRLQAGGTIDVQFRRWDGLRDWSLGRETTYGVCNYLYLMRRYSGTVTLFSELQEVPTDLWQFIYASPRVRIGWFARDLLQFGNLDRFKLYCQESLPFRHLFQISNTGIWPCVILPVSGINVRLLPEMVAALIEATRGARIELQPTPLMPLDPEAPTPQVEDYVRALLAIYLNPRVPLRLISPLSWVVERIDSQMPLVSSPVAAGAELAVLPNGDLYPGECSLGLPRWRLGNVVEGAQNIRWELLDAIAEESSYSLKPDPCRSCPWRYRCGGADVSLSLLEARRSVTSESTVESGVAPTTASNLFDFYCAPRKQLFEELLWGSVEAAARGQLRAPRERLELANQGIVFKPVNS